MPVVSRKQSLRDGMPKETNLVDPMHGGPDADEFKSNKNLAEGRATQARPLVPGIVKGAGNRRKGRRARAR